MITFESLAARDIFYSLPENINGEWFKLSEYYQEHFEKYMDIIEEGNKK